MSSKYKFADNDKLYFVSFAVCNRIDLFIREVFKGTDTLFTMSCCISAPYRGPRMEAEAEKEAKQLQIEIATMPKF